MLAANDVDAWIFGEGRWYIRDPDGAYVAHEQHAIRMTPTVVRDPLEARALTDEYGQRFRALEPIYKPKQ